MGFLQKAKSKSDQTPQGETVTQHKQDNTGVLSKEHKSDDIVSPDVQNVIREHNDATHTSKNSEQENTTFTKDKVALDAGSHHTQTSYATINTSTVDTQASNAVSQQHTTEQKPSDVHVSSPVKKPDVQKQAQYIGDVQKVASQNQPIQTHANEQKTSIENQDQSLMTQSILAEKDAVHKDEVLLQLQGLQEGEPITIFLDRMIHLLEEAKQKTLSFDVLASQLDVSFGVIEHIVRVLDKKKIVRIHYPLNVLSAPKVTLLDFEEEKNNQLHLAKDKKCIEQYTVHADYVTAHIRIWAVPFENTPIYEIVHHDISYPVRCFLESLVEPLAEQITGIKDKDEDPKKKYMDGALRVLASSLPGLPESQRHFLAGYLVHRAYGLGELEIVLADNWLEEVAINGHEEPLSLYHKRYGWLKTTKFFDKESEIYNFASQIGRRVGKQINTLNPIMDAHLQTGDRVAATLSPISTMGDTLTIRRFSRNPWTVVHMIDPKNHTMSKEVMSFMWMAMQYELNIMVVGGTASGKTSVLNTLASLIPPTNRIISIEDTREISLPKALHWNWVPLVSKSANAEGRGEVSMLDLMVASLRMRPDRIIVGEIRRKQQAESLFEAMHTGHSVAATMHADTAEQVKRRLTQPPIDIPENELQALQLVCVQYRDRRRGVRRTLEVAELLPAAHDEKINLNYLYRWLPRRDKFVKDEHSVRVIEDMNLHTGMTQHEVEQDLHEKELILQWMLDNKIMDVDKVGQVMRIYYKYPKLLLDTIKDSGNASSLFSMGEDNG
ncbi:MAG: type II/IV secretion system ATPase subunit [Candidatus Woesearchaeota archaeon]